MNIYLAKWWEPRWRRQHTVSSSTFLMCPFTFITILSCTFSCYYYYLFYCYSDLHAYTTANRTNIAWKFWVSVWKKCLTKFLKRKNYQCIDNNVILILSPLHELNCATEETFRHSNAGKTRAKKEHVGDQCQSEKVDSLTPWLLAGNWTRENLSGFGTSQRWMPDVRRAIHSLCSFSLCYSLYSCILVGLFILLYISLFFLLILSFSDRCL